MEFKTACAAGNQLIALQTRQLVDLTALIVQFRASRGSTAPFVPPVSEMREDADTAG